MSERILVARDRCERMAEDVERAGAILSFRGIQRELDAAPRRQVMLVKQMDRARVRGDEDALQAAIAERDSLRQEVERLRQRVETLEIENGLDAVTGVASRRKLEKAVESEWRRCSRSRDPLAAIFVDLDNFKQINDHHDHAIGDRVLRAVGEQLQRAVRRSGETVGRYGGDEFVLLIPRMTLQEVATLAERCRAALGSMRVQIGQVSIGVTASFGVASQDPYSEGLVNPMQLVLAADRAAKAAKQMEGKNRVCAMLHDDNVAVVDAQGAAQQQKAPARERATSRGGR